MQLLALVHVPDLARTLVADHARPHRLSRVADLAEELAVGRRCKAPEDLVAAAGRVLGDVLELDIELLLGIVLLELFLEPETGAGDDREAPPLDIGGFEDLVHDLLCLDIAFAADSTGIGIVHPVRAVADLLDEHQETEAGCPRPRNRPRPAGPGRPRTRHSP